MNKKKKIKGYLNFKRKNLETISENIDYSWHSNVLESIKRFFGEESEQYKTFNEFKNFYIFSKAKNTKGLESNIESERKRLINFFDETIGFLKHNLPREKKNLWNSIIKFAVISVAFTIGWSACYLFKFDYEKQKLYEQNKELKHQVDSLLNQITITTNDSININHKN